MVAFYFDMTSCIGCKACQMACKDKNNLPLGILYREVKSYEVGEYPMPGIYHTSLTCNHCVDPACVKNCPTGAMYKDPDTGLVLHDDEMCIGCGMCVQSCPYHEPLLMEKNGKTVSAKCDGCYTLVQKGQNPVCVDACGMRALEFGEMVDIVKAHPDAVQDIKPLPDSSETVPAFFIDPTPEALTEEIAQVF